MRKKENTEARRTFTNKIMDRDNKDSVDRVRNVVESMTEVSLGKLAGSESLAGGLA